MYRTQVVSNYQPNKQVQAPLRVVKQKTGLARLYSLQNT